ncbi:MAG: hypothetical protein PHX70_03835 [Clostridium sp.]|nr:hypothetical protein [Clostridium sp.]
MALSNDITIPVNLFEDLYLWDNKKLKKEYEFLGQGASRIAYGIDDNYVIKISKNRTGKYQCKTEHFIYNDLKPEYKKYFCPVIWYKPGMIAMMRANSFTKILGIKHGSIFDYTTIKRNSVFFKNIKKIASHYDLLYPDIKTISSWGILDDKPVLIDYGCTNSLYDRYFD